ncbi:MAG: adenylate/guanylate cyclase domain-containing protein [Simkaniaceae bacterium]
MKYRSKLFFSFSFLALLSTCFALAIIYRETYTLVFGEIRHKALTVAATAAAVIPGDEVEKITGQDEPKKVFDSVLKELFRIRNANRRVHTYVKYIYIVFPSKVSKDKFIFAVDADEVSPAKYGSPFIAEESDYEALKADHPMVMQDFEVDQWGSWLTAYAPIFNSQGKKVGTVGVDISHTHINELIKSLTKDGVIALGFTLFIAVSLAHLLSKVVSHSLSSLSSTIHQIGCGDLNAKCHLDTNDEFNDLASGINSMTEGLKERERLKLGFSRYVSNYVLDKILQSDIATKLEGERKQITILFSDIRQFTALSETLSPEQVVLILNQYFAKMINIIFKYQGTLDKFIGDGMMVEFGAPLEDVHQERNALLAALHMQKEMEALNEEWQSQGLPYLHMGIGIHTGHAVVGNVGSEQRMEYTAIGDAVNVAARLEQMTKSLKKPIIISKATYEKVKDQFFFEDLGEMQLPGRKEKTEAFHLLLEENFPKIKS